MSVLAKQIASLALAPAASALAPAEPVGMGTLTPGRLGAGAAALVALAGIALGVRALRSVDRGADAARAAAAALVAGLLASLLGGVIVATAKGGLGTGQGLGGGVVALAAGVLSILLGGLGLARSQRLKAGA